jgi:hypothetical protein
MVARTHLVDTVGTNLNGASTPKKQVMLLLSIPKHEEIN